MRTRGQQFAASWQMRSGGYGSALELPRRRDTARKSATFRNSTFPCHRFHSPTGPNIPLDAGFPSRRTGQAGRTMPCMSAKSDSIDPRKPLRLRISASSSDSGSRKVGVTRSSPCRRGGCDHCIMQLPYQLPEWSFAVALLKSSWFAIVQWPWFARHMWL